MNYEQFLTLLNQILDKRFAEFEIKLDQKLDQKLDKRFADFEKKLDKRFEKIDKRFEKIEKNIKEIKDYINVESKGIENKIGEIIKKSL